MPTFGKADAIAKLNQLAAQGRELEAASTGSPEFKRWRRDVEIALSHIFGEKSRHIEDFQSVRYHPSVWSDSTPDSYFHEVFRSGLDAADAVLSSMMDEIHEYWSDDPPTDSEELLQAPTTSSPPSIFVVHGHDNELKEAVARFVEALGLHPIILHEQANEGRTIIEKFTDHAAVQGAIVLLSPDDRGAAGRTRSDLRPRARQNVIFEFGFFVGTLGRQNTIGIVKGDIELPSDYHGVAYIEFDEAGAWRLLLVKELKSAGFDVDANKAL